MGKMKELLEALMSDKDIRDTPLWEEYGKTFMEMERLTNRIMSLCVEYADEHGEEDKGWANTILISLARATCKMLYSIEKSGDGSRDLYKFYHGELLPLTKVFAYRECMVAEEQEEDEEKLKMDSFVTSETRRELLLAIADPDMKVEDIVGRFFRKDLPEKARRGVEKYIANMRRDHAAELKMFRKTSGTRYEN